MPARLRIEVIDSGTGASSSVSAGGSVIRIGRDPENECVVGASAVSGRHAVLRERDGLWCLEDCGSRTGTYARREGRWDRVTGSVALDLPAEIRVGRKHVLRVAEELPGAAKDAAYGSSQMESIGDLESKEAIFVLDICGSSTAASADDRMAFHLKKRTDEIVGPILTALGARFAKSTGDGWLVTFAGATAALDAARQALRKLAERNRKTRNPHIHVRIALHAGKTYVINPETKDRHGHDVDTTFRMEGVQEVSFDPLDTPLPREDRILCSRAFLERLREEPGGPEAPATRCGRAKLKGIREPVEIFALPWEA